MSPEQLRQIRRDAKMSQAQLGAYLGLSRDYVGMMERGVAPIKPRTAMAVSTLSHQSIADPGALGPPRTNDPMERLVEHALRRAGIRYEVDRDGAVPANLDFYLPDHDVYLEVKRFHSDRIAEQMSRAANVIAVQGETAIRFFCERIAASAADRIGAQNA